MRAIGDRKSSLCRLLAFLRLGRLHFLAGGFLFYGLGTVMALYEGAALDWSAVLWGQIAVTATQLMTHYANDYFDLEADRANRSRSVWSGGSRVLVENLLPPPIALGAALVFAGLALVANIVLSTGIRPGWTTFSLFLLAQALAWFYSAPPLRLHSRGLGELTALIVVPLLTPLSGFYLQYGEITPLPLLALLPLLCLQLAMLLAIEFPDAEGDATVGKQTLVLRLGGAVSARLYQMALLLAYVLLLAALRFGLPRIVALGMAALMPLAAWLIWRIECGDWRRPPRWNSLTFASIALLVGTGLVALLCFLLVFSERTRFL